MTKNYGKVGWKDNASRKTNKFAILENGANTVRIISNVYKYFVHKIKFKGDTMKFGRTIKCAIDDCPLCKDGNEAKPKYIAGVIINDEVKYLDMGPGLYNEISSLATNMPGFDNPLEYSIRVVRNPKGGATGFYKAYPAAKEPLTAKQMAAVESDFNEEDLEKFIQPISPDEVNASIERISSWLSKNIDHNSGDSKESQKETTSVVSDDDYDFIVKKS